MRIYKYINHICLDFFMAIFLTEKDAEVLRLINDNNGKNKSSICRKSKYIYSGLQHTFNKLEQEGLISIVKDTFSYIHMTPTGIEVLKRL